MKRICKEKDCKLAGIEQDIVNFGLLNKAKNWYRLICKKCQNKKARENCNERKNNPNIKEPNIKIQICSNKNCQFADQEQSITEFRLRTDKTYNKKCLTCTSITEVKYYQENKEEILEYQKNYQEENKEIVSERASKYYQENKIEINKQRNQYRRNQRKQIPSVKLRENISRSIRAALKENNSSKNGQSCLNKLQYTIEDLKNHLEKLFEYWMNWNNWGIYNPKTWDDNDYLTWTWQLDHIIPHSEFNYISMDDQEFKDCWALDNLRPLSAKQNILDGVNRTRHKQNN